MNETLTKVIGWQYKDGGRDFVQGIVDCYGLIIYLHKELYGIDLPDFDYTTRAESQLLLARNYHKFAQVISESELQFGDVCLYSTKTKGVDHMAFYIGGYQIIHAAEGLGVITSPLRHPRLYPKLECYIRYND